MILIENLVTPLKWISSENTYQYFEKKNNIWFETYNDRSYNEVSIAIDTNGYPYIILVEYDAEYFLNLTENMAYKGDSSETIKSKYEKGVWVKKKFKKSTII